MHGLHKFSLKTKVIQVGNGAGVNILFIIPIIITIQSHIFEIYIKVAEIHDDIDLVLGVKTLLN